MKWAVLCQDGDAAGDWLAAALARAGLDGMQVVTASEIARGQIEFTIAGATSEFSIALEGGRQLHSATLQGAVNRIWSLPPGCSGHDREYAFAERAALFVAVMASLPCPVLGGRTPRELSGRWRSHESWKRLAAAAGFQVAEDDTPAKAAQARGRTVFVVGGDVAPGTAPPAAVPCCAELARLAHESFLGIDVMDDVQECQFLAASPVADVRRGGPQVVALVARHLAS